MQSNIDLESVNELVQRYQSLYNKSIVKKSNIELEQNRLLDTKDSYNKSVLDLQKILQDQHTYELSIDTLKKMLDKLSHSQINHLSDLLNSAVSSIFFDRQYSIELQITELRNQNQLKILLHEDTPDGHIVSDINDNGYGLKGIIGFILQVYFIIYYKQTPVLFLDEAFGNLSSQYLPYLKALMISLTNKYGFMFVLITHDERLMELADKSYRVKLGEVSLVNDYQEA
jgi:ABC-type iron transport system FetAB ATPase subunit